jgi:phosphatidylglycerol---prolipoprotein diacylglyceryl transferase
MHPVLLKLGRLEIFAYGVMLALSFLIGIFWAMRRAEKRGMDKNLIMDLSVLIAISAILGSRFLYVVTHISEFKGRWLDTINPLQSTGEIGIAGLSMLGGVVLAIAVVIVFAKKKKMNLLVLCDVLSPMFALGLFLTRIGCFLNGCCFGKPCDLPWGMVFPLISPAGSTFQGVHIHPTQLYSSIAGLILTIFLLWLDRKPRFDGFITAMFFIAYGAGRFLVDFLRYYETPGQFNINQIISALMFAAGVALWVLAGKAARQS